MVRFCLAATLAFGAASAHAQPPSAAALLHPSVDSAEQRQTLRDLTACLARHRPLWARQALSRPYLSSGQASFVSQALSGRDTCIRGPEVEVTFRTSSLVGSLAEHFLRAEISRVDFARLTSVLSRMAPLNATEDFALCVASRNPTAARNLALSDFGSAAEMEAAQQLAHYVEPCTGDGEQLTVDLQSLRALTSTALYRGVTAVLRSGN